MNRTLGIRREDKSEWERRAPLAPEHVKLLKDEHGITTVIQPSQTRVFTDDEYRDAGAIVAEDLSGCHLVVAVKEIPTRLLEQGKAYLYFSHTIKGQPYNMGMLAQLQELGCTLMDHEKITDARNRRLVLFGYHAGLAGMIDSLWALGRRLTSEGLDTPFAKIKQAYQYPSLEAAEAELAGLRAAIEEQGLPAAMGPVVVGLTGYGNVSLGGQHIVDLLGPEQIEPAQLGDLKPGRLYKVVFREQDMVERLEGGAESFELQEYYDHPERYRSVFDKYLEQLTVLVNCIYWEPRYPRLVTTESLRPVFEPGKSPRLRVIGDISCDVEGSVECTSKATQPDEPVYVFDPIANQVIDGVEGNGPVIMAVDNLPCELPREATVSFGKALAPLLPGAMKADLAAPWDELELPDTLRRAVILYRGKLTPDYQYLEEHLAKAKGSALS